MKVPTTGIFFLDVALAFLIFLAGVFILIKKESKLGFIVIATALFWAYKLVAPHL